MLIDFGDPRSEHWELMKRETMPPQRDAGTQHGGADARRARAAGATADWHLIACEWLFGDPPSTELGAAEDGVPRARRPPDHAGAREHARRGGRACAPAGRPADGRADRALRAPRGRAGPRGRRPGDAYGALIRAIVGQQLSTKAARSIFDRLVEYFGGHTPTPRQLLDADPEEMRARRAVARQGTLPARPRGARRGRGAALDELAELPDEEVAEQLTAVKGLGPWTVTCS